MHFGIIAAGEGSRLAAEGVRASKPLLPIGGEPMIERLIRIFKEAGAESISIVASGRMPDVTARLEELKPQLDIPLNIEVRTTPSSLHTFSELCRMLPEQGRYIVTTVDTIFREEDFRRYVEAFREAPADVDGMMAVTDFIDDEKPLYVATDANMRIKDFQDAPEEGVKYVSGGIYGLDGKAKEVASRCLERGVSRMRNFQRALIEEGLSLKAFPMGKIVDVDHAADISGAEELIRKK